MLASLKDCLALHRALWPAASETELLKECAPEIHRRKTFWVDEALAWQLEHPDLDLVGSLLRLPFTSCAFALTDRLSLGLAERIMARETTRAGSGVR